MRANEVGWGGQAIANEGILGRTMANEGGQGIGRGPMSDRTKASESGNVHRHSRQVCPFPPRLFSSYGLGHVSNQELQVWTHIPSSFPSCSSQSGYFLRIVISWVCDRGCDFLIQIFKCALLSKIWMMTLYLCITIFFLMQRKSIFDQA